MLHATKEHFCELAGTYRRDEKRDFLTAVWMGVFAEADCTMDTDTAVKHANHAQSVADSAWNEINS